MLYFLLFLLIVFIVIPVGSAMLKIWQMHRRVNQFMRDPFGMGGTASGRDPRGTRRQEPRHPRRTHKKIDPDVGEYVAFTEVETSSKTDTYTSGSTTSVRTEQQIVDVEWEDIPDKK